MCQAKHSWVHACVHQPAGTKPQDTASLARRAMPEGHGQLAGCKRGAAQVVAGLHVKHPEISQGVLLYIRNRRADRPRAGCPKRSMPGYARAYPVHKMRAKHAGQGQDAPSVYTAGVCSMH